MPPNILLFIRPEGATPVTSMTSHLIRDVAHTSARYIYQQACPAEGVGSLDDRGPVTIDIRCEPVSSKSSTVPVCFALPSLTLSNAVPLETTTLADLARRYQVPATYSNWVASVRRGDGHTKRQRTA